MQTNLSEVPALSDDHIYFIPLGGTGEIGMNLNVYQLNNSLIAVDLGMTFADESLPGIDLLVPDPEYLVKNKKKLLGLLITHAHEDHIGAIPYIWPELQCPIYATPFAGELISQKCNEFSNIENIPLNIVSNSKPIKLGPFEISYIPITHSIPEARSLQIKTHLGTLVHTGDWKLDKDPLIGPKTKEKTFRTIGKKGVIAVIGDSTNAPQEGWSGSELTVKKTFLELFQNKKGTIAVTHFSSNIARLVSIISSAHSVNREVVLVGRSLKKYFNAAKKTGVIKDLRVLSEEEGKNLHPDQIILVCTGCQGEPRAAMSKLAGEYHPCLSLESGDTVIFSSKIIPGNEKPIAVLKNKLNQKGIKIIDENFKGVHVSGHPHKDEIKELYSWLKPKAVIPVHGENRHLQSHSNIALDAGIQTSPIIKNGDILKIAPGKVEVVCSIQSGKLAVDGSRLLKVNHPSIKRRNKLKENGIVLVAMAITKTGRLLGEVSITGHGIFDSEDETLLINKARILAMRIINEDKKLSIFCAQNTKEKIRLALKKFFKDHYNKKPRIEVQLILTKHTHI